MESGLASDGAVAQDSQQMTSFWRLRKVNEWIFSFVSNVCVHERVIVMIHTTVVYRVSLKHCPKKVLSINMTCRYQYHIYMRLWRNYESD